MKNSLLILFCLLFFVTSCTHKTFSNSSEYLKWLDDPGNGCVVTKEVNGMNLEVKYLTPEYLALKESKDSGQKAKLDSLIETYRNSVTFLISFRPKEGHKGEDIMYKELNNYKEYVERSMTLNFDLESKLNLRTDAGEYSPVLSSLENTYGLTKGRDVYVVFASRDKSNELGSASYYDLSYSDETYGLGILHFVFDYKNIRTRLPLISI